MIPFSKNKLSLVFLAAFSAASLSGCNLFDPLDTPTNDDQIISAARACFDQSDLVCAKEYYNKLASDSDVRNSELAFAALDENGIGMSVFLGAFGSGGSGAGISALASRLAVINKNNSATRIAFYQAYQKAGLIKSAGLRGLVRFTTATAIASEILSEGAGINQKLDKSDYVSSPTGCAALTTTTCATSTNCDAASSGFLSAGSNINYDSTTEAVLQTNPTIGMLNGAFTQIQTALGSSEIGASGKFGSGSGSLATSLGISGDLSTAPIARCYRNTLLSQTIGAD